MGLTAAEFSSLMAKLLKHANAELRHNPALFPLGRVIISCDNASWHRSFMASRAPDELNAIPAHSPDIHKVVEHPLGPFNKRWYKEFTLARRCTTCESSMALASDILNRTTADSIWRDIQTLGATFQSILDNGGDWAAAALC